MRRIILALTIVSMALPVYAGPAQGAHQPQPGCNEPGRKIQGYIEVAKGTPEATTLHYQVLLPKVENEGPGPYPAVLDYSGYQPGITFYDGVHRHFLCEGYAVAGVNIRGTGCSGGKFDYFEPRQAEDGREAIEFLTKQDWSNGRLAMVGKSYPGITQLFVAGQPLQRGGDPETPEGLVAIVPGHVFGDLYRDVPFPGGIMNVTFAAGWSAGRIYEPFTAPAEHFQATNDEQCMRNAAEHVQNPPFNPFVKALYNQYDGDLFKERSPWYWADNIDVPTMLVEAWQDEQVGSRATDLTERFDPALTWRMLATNGDHGEYYGSDVLPYIDEFLRFYLAEDVPQRFEGGTVTTFVPAKNSKPSKPKGTYETRPETFEEALARYEAEPPVQINWETGAGGNRVPAWIERYGSWPAPEQTTWRLNLDPSGTLVSSDAQGGTVDYAYTPGAGTQQRGGFELTDDLPDETMATWAETPAEGTYAQFETAPLESDKLLAGPASLDLTVSSTAVDTDFQVTMTEIRPDGGEVFVQQGWLRASHRVEDEASSTEIRPYHTHLLEDVAPLVPGEATPVRIEVFPFAHAFRAGSKLRIYVEAPHTKPDLWGFALLPTPAMNTIYTGPGLSSIALPLLEGATAKAPLPPCGSLRNQPCRPAL
jgi:predicted acyl esterase